MPEVHFMYDRDCGFCMKSLALCAAVLLLGACSDPPRTDPAPQGTERGAVLSQEPMPATSTGAAVTKIRYRSTSGVDGGGAEVTGTVFTPAGPAPSGGWPIVTVGHGTTGVDDECAPSKYPDLLGSISLVTPLLERRFVVVVSDLQGLGSDDPHPYLEPNAAAYDLIDAVRAARFVVPDTSTKWAALGVSQGGQASWAAAERAADYGDGLDFVGSANLSPAADISGVAATDGDVNLSIPQQIFLPSLIAGLQVLHPELNPDDYMHGNLAANKAILLACTGPDADRKLSVALKLKKEDSRPSSTEAKDRMATWLRDLALPKTKAAGPMLVVVGEHDPVIFPQWTRAAVQRACALGDVVEWESRADEGHGDSRAIPGAVAWIVDRVAGAPAPNSCGQL
nr:lipase family protein [Antrihabitans stalactiti]